MGWVKSRQNGLEFYQCREMNDGRVVQAFSTRNCGNLALHTGDDPEAVIRSRTKFLGVLGLDLANLAAATQVHDAVVQKVDKTMKGSGAFLAETAFPGVDALITREPGVILAIHTADCLPVFFYDPVTPAVGLAHAGWRGTLERVAPHALSEMVRAYGTDPGQCLVAMGTAIGKECFEVGENVAESFGEICPESVFPPASVKGYRVDLARCNAELLMKAGVLPEQIIYFEGCTVCRKDEFFSYRADHGTTGRMMGIITIANQFPSSRVHKFASFRVPEFPSSRVPEFPSSRVPEFASSQVH